jgi:hypothetical protein
MDVAAAALSLLPHHGPRIVPASNALAPAGSRFQVGVRVSAGALRGSRLGAGQGGLPYVTSRVRRARDGTITPESLYARLSALKRNGFS